MAGHFAGSYYLCGYAIECALKACIAVQFRANEFPNKKIVNDSYVHDLDKLFKLSGLDIQFQTARNADSALEVNWAVVKDWSEQKRYDPLISQVEAQELYNAVGDVNSGVLTWIKTHW